MWHVTIETGHARWSPRDEVAPEIIDMLAPKIAAGGGVDGGIPWTVNGIADGAVEISIADAVRMVVSRELNEALWRELYPQSPSPQAGPWCAVEIDREALASLPAEDVMILGDMERCLAWAWLDLSPAG